MFFNMKGCCPPEMRNAWREVFGETNAHTIPLDVFENAGGEYVVRASLPGFRKEDVDISFEDGVLSISAKRTESGPESEDKFFVQERAQGTFSRKLKLLKASGEGIKAELKDGVLTLTLQRAQEAKARTVEIQ